MNIVLGIIGAAVASAIFGFFGVRLGGWIGYLIAGFIGGVLLIWIVRLVRGHPVEFEANQKLTVPTPNRGLFVRSPDKLALIRAT